MRTGTQVFSAQEGVALLGSTRHFAYLSDAAADPDRGSITWRLSGTDGGDFSSSGNGQLTFDSSPGFETPADADRASTYGLAVETTDGRPLDALSVTPVNDAPVATYDALSRHQDAVPTSLHPIGNDTDLGGGTVSLSSLGNAAGGSSSVSNSNPDSDLKGSASATSTVSGGTGGTGSGTVTFAANSGNTDPVAVDDTMSVAEDAPVTDLDVIANDTDADRDTLSVSAVGTGEDGPSNGTAVVTSGSTTTISYTPDPDFHGGDSFTYTVSDGNGGTDTGTVTVTVTAVADDPVANNDSLTVAEDASATDLDVIANDTDADGDTLSVSAVGTGEDGPSNGTAVVTSGSTTTISYTPNPDFHGGDSFTYTVFDGNGGTATGTVTVTVTSVNDAPVAGSNRFTVNEDSKSIHQNVLYNDTDVDGDMLSVSTVSAASHGTTRLANGRTVYTPNPNFHGSDSFTYTVSDGNGGTDTGTVNMIVRPVADDPVADDDAMSVAEDTQATDLDVIANDTDADGDTLSVSAVGTGEDGPSGGTAALKSGSATAITYTPNADFYGQDSFTYTVSDGNDGTDTGLVIVTVTAVNDAPTFDAGPRPATRDVAENTALGTDLGTAFEASDIDDASSALTYSAEGTDGASFEIDSSSGQLKTNVALDYETKSTYQVVIRVTDSGGGAGPSATSSATITVNVTVTDANDAPVATDDTLAIAEDTSVTDLDVIANDSDQDGDSLSVSAVGTGEDGPSNGTALVTSGSTTTISYTPNPDFHGQDSFTYTVSDGNGGTDTGTVTVTVTAVADDPVASDDAISVAEDASATDLDVIANDTDADGDTLSVSAVGTGEDGPSNGTAVVTSGSTTTISYTPNPDFHGGDSFTYTVSDGNGGIDTGTVNVTVRPVNDVPTFDAGAGPASRAVTENTVSGTNLGAALGASDVDDAAGALTYSLEGADATSFEIDSSIGQLKTSAALDYETKSTYQVVIRVTDSGGGAGPSATSSATITVNITVIDANDAPVATDDTLTAEEDASATDLDVVFNDTDQDGDTLSVSAVSQPTNGTAALKIGSTTEVAYTPNADFYGEDSFTYAVSDGNEGTGTGTVNVTVDAVADPASESPITEFVSNTGQYSDSGISMSAGRKRAQGFTTGNNPRGYTLESVVVRIQSAASNANLTLKLREDFDNPSTTLCTFNTPALGSGLRTFTAPAECFDEPDEILDRNTEYFVVLEKWSGGSSVIVTMTDSDDEDDGKSPGWSIANRSRTYSSGSWRPNPQHALFQFKVRGEIGNTRPESSDETVSTNEDTAFEFEAGDFAYSDADDDPLDHVKITSLPSRGTLKLGNVAVAENQLVTPDDLGDLTYNPPLNQNGSNFTTFDFKVSDGQDDSAEENTITINVSAVNDPPVAVPDDVTTNEETAVVIYVLANDSDVDAATTLTAIEVGSAGNGATAITDDGAAVTYTPAAGFLGTDTFTYTVSDGGTPALTDVGTVYVQVLPKVSGPTTRNYEENGTDAVGSYSANGDPAWRLSGTDSDEFSISAGGTLTFKNSPDFEMPTDIASATDTAGDNSYRLTVEATVTSGQDSVKGTLGVTVTVTNVNDPPVALDDSLTIAEDTSTTTVDVIANDSDQDGDTLSVTAIGTGDDAPTNGTAALKQGSTSTIAYTPNPDFYGQDSFTYTVSDGGGGTDTATVTVTVTPVNDAPSFDAGDGTASRTVAENTGTGTDLGEAFGASDVDDAPSALTYSLEGTDAASFEIVSSTGLLKTFAALDYETKTTYQVVVRVTDSGGGAAAAAALTDTITVDIAVTNVNDPPVALDDSLTIAEDTSTTTVDVIANDSDQDGDTLSVTAIGTGDDAPTNGTAALTQGSTSTIAYTPNADFYGQDSFTYTVSDGIGGTDTATVTVTVTPVNDPPTFDAAPGPASRTVPENTGTGTDLGEAFGASDVDDAPSALTYSLEGTDAASFEIVSSTGLLKTFAALDFETKTTYQVVVRVTDSGGGAGPLEALSDTITVNIAVTNVNDAPVALDDSLTIAEDTSTTTVDVIANDSDQDGDTLSVTAIGTADDAPTNGTAALKQGSTTDVTYTPNPDFYGQDSFTYTVSDGIGGTDTATGTVTVTPVNDAPSFDAGDGTASRTVAENTGTGTDLGEAFGASDVDDAPSALTYSLEGTDAASFEIVSSTGLLKTFAALDYETKSTYQVVVRVTDSGGGAGQMAILTDTITVDIAVTNVNEAPVALDDSLTIAEDTSTTTVDVIANDSDQDGDTLSVTAIGTGDDAPTNGTAALKQGSTSTIAYTPNPDFHGQDSFTYTVSDGIGGTDTATVSVTVTPVNDPPTFDAAPGPASRTVAENTGTGTDLGEAFGASDVDDAPNALTYSLEGTDAASFEIDSSTGLLKTFAALDYETKTTYQVVVRVTDSGGGAAAAAALTDTITVDIAVTNVNDPPVALDDSLTIAEDTSTTTVDVIANDSDQDGDTLSVTAIGTGDDAPANGTAALKQGSTSTIAYTPNPDFHGQDSFTYTVSDGIGGTDTATVTVTVTPVNDAPSFDAGDGTASRTVAENTTSGTDLGEAFGASDVDDAPNALTYSLDGTDAASFEIVSSTGQLKTFAALDYETKTTYQVVVRVTDSGGGAGQMAILTDTITVDIAVTNVNDAPVALDDSLTIAEDTSTTTVDVIANDSDQDGDTLSVTAIGTGDDGPANGTAALKQGSTSTIAYTPNPDFHGQDSFTYTVSDGIGGTDTATVTVTVTPVNDAPSFDAGDGTASRTVAENTGTGPDLGEAFGASDVDDAPNALTYSLEGTDAASFEIVSSTGQLKTFAALDYETKTTYQVVVRVTDSGGGAGAAAALTDTITVNIAVTNVNDAPVALDDSLTIAEDTSTTTVDVIANDSDQDGDTLSVTAIGTGDDGPANGTAALKQGSTSTIAYTLNPDFHGQDSFTYTVSDGIGGTDTATVTVTVTPVNDAPSFDAGDGTASRTVAENTGTGTNLGAALEASDVDDAPSALTYSLEGTDAASFEIVSSTGLLKTFAALDYETKTTYQLVVRVTDSGGGAGAAAALTDTITVNIAVTNVNDPPVALDDSLTIAEDTSTTTVDVIANDSDQDGDTLSVTAIGTGDIDHNPRRPHQRNGGPEAGQHQHDRLHPQPRLPRTGLLHLYRLRRQWRHRHRYRHSHSNTGQRPPNF